MRSNGFTKLGQRRKNLSCRFEPRFKTEARNGSDGMGDHVDYVQHRVAALSCHFRSMLLFIYSTSATAVQRASMLALVMPATLMRPEPTM